MVNFKLHLNDIFVCIDNDDLRERKLMSINFVDHGDDTKHKMIQFDTDDFDLGINDITIEEGESNRIALFKKTEMVFKLFNLESGLCMMNMDLMYILSDFVRGNDFNTKSTNAQRKLKPRSVITRESGELGFLIIPRAQPAG